MQLLDNFLEARQAVHDYFGYVEDWVVIPLDDAREYYWKLNQTSNGSGTVGFAKTKEELESESGEYYENEIYTQRFLPKYVYEAKDFTMISVDTHTDGNKFLQIFDNSKRIE